VGKTTAINPNQLGAKAFIHYPLTIPVGEMQSVRLRLSDLALTKPFADFADILHTRQQEADAFY
jgi:hypothetical protein